MGRGIHTIDRLNEHVGRWVSYLILIIVGVVCYEIVMRKFFRAPTEWAFDLTIYLYGAHFIWGFGYCLLYRGHVKVDIIYEQFKKPFRTWLRIITFMLLFLPFTGCLTYASWDYAIESWVQLERGQSTWRPPLYLVKTVMPIGITLLLLQGISNFVSDLCSLKK